MRMATAVLGSLTTHSIPRRHFASQSVRMSPRLHSLPQHVRGIVKLKDFVHRADATAQGDGRIRGVTKSGGDSPIDLDMDMPKATGNKGLGSTPEQLLGMAYAMCYLGSLQLMAARAGKELDENVKVHTKVFVGHPEHSAVEEGLGLSVEVAVEGIDDDNIIATADNFCAYSRALREGCEISVVNLKG